MTEEKVFGLDTNRVRADELMCALIRNEWLQHEPSLYRGKWFDYRLMSPVQATYLYAHHYKRHYLRLFRTYIDSARASHIRVFRTIDPFADAMENGPRQTAAKTKIAGLWRGRQVADAMGMPYSLYLERAFHWTLQYWQKGHLPQPQQLYTDLVTDRVAQDWDEMQRARLYYSKLPYYENRNYRGYQSQDDHHEWLLAAVMKRPNIGGNFADLIYREGLLPEEKVKARLQPDFWEMVQEQAERIPASERYIN